MLHSQVIPVAVLVGAGSVACAADEHPTFARDVAPIIFQHCSVCHQPGQAAPFPLLTYDDVSKRARQIAMVTASRYMPPWLPVRGGDQPHFVGARGLDEGQIELVRRWVEAGAPRGDGGDGPHEPRPAPIDAWPLGPPDHILTIEGQYMLPAEGLDVVRTFVVRNDTMGDLFVKAAHVRCSNEQAIHHASFLADETGHARQLDEADAGPGYASMGDIGLNLAGSLGVWSSGSAAGVNPGAAKLPRGVARIVPPEADLVAEVHFKPTGKPEPLTLEIGLYTTTTEPIDRHVIPLALGSFFIDIAAGEKSYTVKDSLTLTADAQVLSIAPRAHYVCRTMKVKAMTPDGQTLPLLRIDDWDFNWMQEYRYAAPLCLPAGTRIDMEFVYDNSAENPRNPSNPPRPVRNGFRPTDEMGLLFLYVVPDQRGDHAVLNQAMSRKLASMMQSAQEQQQRSD